MAFDLTLDRVQNTRFRNVYNTVIKQMAKETNLIESEIRSYLLMYHKFALMNGKKFDGYMTKKQLASFLQLYFDIYDKYIIDNITRVMSDESFRFDIIVSPRSWIQLINIYESETLDDHIKFCFRVYDIYTEGFLSRHVVSIFTENYFIGDDDESEELKEDMLGVLMERFDIDKDGIISFEDYRTTVYRTPALLQFLGICIPPRQTVGKLFSKDSLRSKKRTSVSKECVR